MEDFTGGRQVANPEDFPEHIAPFPDSTDCLVFANQTAVVHSQPQKLRPIRSSSGRSPTIELPDNAANLGNSGPAQVGSGTGTWEHEVEDESSSSPDDDGDEYLKTEDAEPMTRKRKRSSRRGGRLERVELFMRSLVMKVMEKQEEMHKQLIEMIETREKERIGREDAWKQQELDRMKREQEIRTQETSRSLALISFIQNYLGHEIQVHQPAQAPASAPPATTLAPLLVSAAVPNNDHQRCMEENGSSDNIGTKGDLRIVIKSDGTNRGWPEVEAQSLKNDGTPSRRWPEAEVQTLITLRGAFEHKFRVAGNLKGPIWEEISLGMHDMGYNRSARKCKEKWENMNKYVKRSLGSEKKRSGNAKSCPYFHELELLHKNGLISSGDGAVELHKQPPED